MKKTILVCTVVALAAGLAALLFFVIIPEINYDSVRKMPIANVDVGAIADGSYHGQYAYGSYTYQADVTVKDGVIAKIDVRHGRDSEHARAAEGVVDRILAEQRVDVDVVSGATTTSKAILKAVENALTAGE